MVSLYVTTLAGSRWWRQGSVWVLYTDDSVRVPIQLEAWITLHCIPGVPACRLPLYAFVLFHGSSDCIKRRRLRPPGIPCQPCSCCQLAWPLTDTSLSWCVLWKLGICNGDIEVIRSDRRQACHINAPASPCRWLTCGLPGKAS